MVFLEFSCIALFRLKQLGRLCIGIDISKSCRKFDLCRIFITSCVVVSFQLEVMKRSIFRKL
jgi:hypothetical protein